MKKLLLLFALAITFFAGCSNKQSNQPEKIDGKFLLKQINKAIDGNSTTNDSLGNIVNLKFPVNPNYNKLKVDSLRTRSGRLFYYVLAEFPNPVYNFFAVYDSSLNLLLLDKSLNGFLTEDKFQTDGLSFIKVSENFNSKSVINLERLSLYSIGDSTARLVFRTFTKMSVNKLEFAHQINGIAADRIKTNITSNRYSVIRNKSDVFEFNSDANRYLSQNNLFDNFVLETIKKTNDDPKNPQITDLKSMWESVGVDPNSVTQDTSKSSFGELGFSLNLSDDWKVFKDFSISQSLNKEFKGTKYLNNTLGTTISVIEIPAANNAEDFIKYKLDKSSEGRFKLRYTDEIIENKVFIRFYEYSCGNRKFLIILRGSKFTYNDYKDLYDKIINSFSMDC